MKKKPVWRIVAGDILVLGAALLVFALFHHVLPTRKAALNLISVPLTAQAEAAESAQTSQTAAAEAQDGSSYIAEGVKLSISEYDYLGGSVHYYLADILLDDVTRLRTALAGDTYGSGYTDTVQDMDSLLNAALCVNGDYYGSSDEGVVVRNGVIYRANYTQADILCLYYDGSMRVSAGAAFDAEGEAARGIWQAWTFGPSLLDAGGRAKDSFSEGRHMSGKNPRTVLGYYGPGHYALLVVDGRGDSAGLTLKELAELSEEVGFTLAYNLDGGKSSVMTFNDALVNEPAGGGRAVSDVIYIAGEDS
ncbi:MAG: phosphodiester glycosidase family protein [Christensenellales bacterium]